jgi:hypothetical protein
MVAEEAAVPEPGTATAVPADATAGGPAARRLPPVAQLAVGSMILVITGGIYLVSDLPRPQPLGPAIGLLAAAGVLLLANVASLARLHEFAWDKFFLVGGWALAAYVVIGGMLEYVFVLDHVRGGLLAVLTLMLAVFSVNIPLLLAFSVAQYQPARGGH